MAKRSDESLRGLEREVLDMGELVEAQLDAAVASLLRRDAVIAEEVLRSDDAIDALDVRIGGAGLSALTNRALAATDVRLVIGLVKVVTQLERVGDLAVNIAERATALAALPPLPPFDDLPRMAARVQSMVKLALISLATRDVCVASQVLGMDALVDELHRDAFRHHEELMRADPDTVERAVLTLSSSRHLERVGDHAKNIAADLVWIVEARVLRQDKESGREKILIGA